MWYPIAKSSIAIAWLLIIANLWVNFPEPVTGILYWMGVSFIVAHILEAVFFHPRVKHADGNPFKHYILLFIFGALHGLQLPKSSKQG